MAITDLTIREMAQAMEKKEFSSVELTQEYLARIRKYDDKIKAYITVCEDVALAAAAASDARRAKGEALSELDGIPMSLKDNICTDGVLTTCASRILENFVPPYNATCWQKLVDAGAVLLGKVNLDEFAMGGSTENSCFGPSHNPFDLECVPGGSSGGSGAAVAADMAAYSLGTDTGGSVRQPAHYCGVAGIKPTYGRVSRYGVVAYASSLDQVGILAKNSYDTASVLETISGHDKMDTTSLDAPVGSYRTACDRDIRGMKIGVPSEFLGEGMDEDVVAEMRTAMQKLRDLGAVVEEISLPLIEYAVPTYYMLATAEASSNLSRYDGVRFGPRADAENVRDMFVETRSKYFGAEVKRRIMLGTYALSSGYYDAYYNKTLKVRRLIRDTYANIFAQGFDCLLTPAAPSPAFKLGQWTDDPMTMYLQEICTSPMNLTGLPGLVVPVGLSSKGLPIGLQVVGKSLDEETCFAVSSKIESIRLLPDLKWED